MLPPIHTVTNLQNAGPGSLRHAVANAPDGAWIVFDTQLPAGLVILVTPIVVDRPTVIGGLSGTFDRFTISGNNATRLFDVDPGASLDLRDLVLTGGNAGGSEDGGAIRAQDAELRLSRVTIASCHAPLQGGGALYQDGGTLRMTDCAVTACTAWYGGGIHALRVDGHVERSSFYLNTATTTVGGAMNLAGVRWELLNSTVTGNQATHALGDGAGISVVSNGTYGNALLWIWASTITNNTAGDQGGGVLARGYDGEPCTVSCFYSIVADNHATVGADIRFAAGASGYGRENLIGIGDNQTWFNGFDDNHVGDWLAPLDPLLGPVTFHSHGRAVHVPLPGSPAVDTVSEPVVKAPNGNPFTTDQRGQDRVQGGAPDKGAVER